MIEPQGVRYATNGGLCLPPTVLRLIEIAFSAALAMLLIGASGCFGQTDFVKVSPVRTDSPRQTFESLTALMDDLESALLAYRRDRSESIRHRISRIGDEFLTLIDLSSVPEASRRKRGVETGAALLDILGRIDLPAVDEIPDADQYDVRTDRPVRWRIPDTPIEIVRMREGPREGEFLFSGRTVDQAPRFYSELQDRPLKSRLAITSWSETIAQLTGPMIPARLLAAVPDLLKRSWLDTPVWKILAACALFILAALAVLAWNRLVRPRGPVDTPMGTLRSLLTPVAIILIVGMAQSFIQYELNVTGSFAAVVASVATVLEFLAAAWVFWLVALMLAEMIIRSPRIPDQSFDASLLRLGARIVGVVGGIVILAYGANSLGVPVYSLVAGLGIGGLAVALAVRPTLENLIGGLILYADRPVRVGDFCSFNEHIGTIESIGVRSTQIRARDRTLISVPNAKFADMEIINWAHCDTMLIQSVIGLRYETELDQLRFVLTKLREMLCAHPKIDTKKVRVSFVGFGASSLDVNIRVYALTREWNEFHAIREDVFLRVAQIVAEAGTGFALPSQTLYLQRDDGVDQTRGGQAAEEVESWRASGLLPFPYMPQRRIDELAGTLDYPPKGSPDYLAPAGPEATSEELLSGEEVQESETDQKAK